MEEELRSLLKNDSALTALVGSSINWGAVPQGEPLPNVALHVIDQSENPTMTGPDGLLISRVQVDCYASAYGNAKMISRAVIAKLDGYRGGGFSGIFWEGSRDAREGGTDDAQRAYSVSLDFLTNWRSSS